MRTKQFRAESKKLLDMMIHSIYTHKEIFLRELISNASDAIDKLYFRSLTDPSVTLERGDYRIQLGVDKENRTLSIRDNGCGMTAEEMEKDLGTIARSGSFDFKAENGKSDDENVDIIGQFGVGFYSAFMVSDLVTVESRAWGAAEANRWQSTGTAGYTIEPCDFEGAGTLITLHIKENTAEENYDEFLEPYRISELVKKYSDYIRCPILLEMPDYHLKEGSDKEYETTYENKTLNSMIPLWRKNKSEVTAEEYNEFYKNKFYDFEDPAAVIHSKTEGSATFNALLFIPQHAPMNYYSTSYEKGLQLYSRGVLIMEKCADLLPDYFSFVRGLVDSEDLSLNISRELLQHDRQLQLIARTIEKRIKSELEKMLANEREKYAALWEEFGMQMTYGLCVDYGMHKDVLQDLLLFYSSTEKKLVTFREYRERMKEGQECIYYACGRSTEAIETLPQTDRVKDKGYEILYMTNQVDEFAMKMLREYDGKKLVNICTDDVDLDTDEEKNTLKEENEAAAELFNAMKETLGDKVCAVRFTNKLKNHAVCLTSDSNLSLEMEQTLNAMPGNKDRYHADVALEINAEHAITKKLKELLITDKEELARYTKLLYAEGCLISGVPLENTAELCGIITGLMTR